MLRKFAFFLFLLLPCVCMADNLDANTNVARMEESIKINESQFDSLVAQVKKRYPNFDWNGFNNLSSGAKRMVIRNYLAQMAFAKIVEDFKADMKSRAKGGVVVEEHNKHTYYYDKADDLYRKDYVTANIMAEAKKRGLLHKTDGAEWLHFKQKDVSTLDKIIAEQTAKAPADTHCDKQCSIPTTKVDQDWAKLYLAAWQKNINNYEKDMRETLEKDKQSLAEYQEEYEKKIADFKERHKDNKDIVGVENTFKSNAKNREKQIKAKEQEFVKEMMQMRKEYEDFKKSTQEIDMWMLKPYNPECEMVSVSCFNVQQIPSNHERVSMYLIKGENQEYISYSYDDVSTKENVYSSAQKTCNCDINNENVTTLTNCSCLIGFIDIVADFDKYRQFENLDRTDIKNGKNQDLDENGRYKHDWHGNSIPVGILRNGVFNLSGKNSRTEE